VAGWAWAAVAVAGCGWCLGAGGLAWGWRLPEYGVPGAGWPAECLGGGGRAVPRWPVGDWESRTASESATWEPGGAAELGAWEAMGVAADLLCVT
jgi:hypothetical protein